MASKWGGFFSWLLRTSDIELAWYNLAVALEKNEDFENTIKAYKRVLELDPDDDNTWDSLSMVFEKSGDLDGAKEARKKANSLKRD